MPADHCRDEQDEEDEDEELGLKEREEMRGEMRQRMQEGGFGQLLRCFPPSHPRTRVLLVR